MPMDARDIESMIKAAIPDAHVTIRDLAGDGDHYAATVISETFRGKSRVQQHQMVLNENRVPADRAGDDTGVSRRGIPDHLPEHRGVHGRLVLQQAVKQPGGRQDQLQHPARVRTGRGSGAGAFPPPAPVPPEGELNH